MNILDHFMTRLATLLGFSAEFAGLIACLFTPAFGQTPTYEEAYIVPVVDGIGHVVRGEAQYEVAAQLIFRAGESRNGAYRDDLRAIVDRYTGSYQNSGLIIQAMHALRKLGEDDAYFREQALDWREDEWNARVAMNVLALSPLPENLHLIEQVVQESESDVLFSALGKARASRDQSERYEKLQTPQDKIGYALLYAAGTWRGSSSGYINPSLQDGFHPWWLNGIRWLRELSEEYPGLVARSIATYTTDSEVLGPQIESVRDHLAHFISEQSRAMLQRLRAAQPEDQ